MNPGYAGRTELPDSLKALFRPVTMIVPDLQMICEIMLFSEGFNQARSLAKKMTVLYKLAQDQLSKQFHYDFALRALKSVLVMAGSLKRDTPEYSEELVLMCTSRREFEFVFEEDVDAACLLPAAGPVGCAPFSSQFSASLNTYPSRLRRLQALGAAQLRPQVHVN